MVPRKEQPKKRVRVSHSRPIILDTPEKVAAANALREEKGHPREWKLGDHCWYAV